MGDRCAYIIDDEELLRKLIRQSLAGTCTDFEEFESAEAFLAGHPNRAPGVIIVDIELPGISGLELLEAIAKGRAAFPVIIVSANGNVPHAVRRIAICLPPAAPSSWSRPASAPTSEKYLCAPPGRA